MAFDALLQGKLVKVPEQRTGASGKPFVTAQMAVAVEGDEAVLASVIAFRPEARAALLALAKGDAVAVAGKAKLNTWADKTTGEPKHGLAVTVEQAMTLYGLGRKRKAAAGRAGGPQRDDFADGDDVLEL
jgi:single-strand DNA-binding protein